MSTHKIKGSFHPLHSCHELRLIPSVPPNITDPTRQSTRHWRAAKCKRANEFTYALVFLQFPFSTHSLSLAPHPMARTSPSHAPLQFHRSPMLRHQAHQFTRQPLAQHFHISISPVSNSHRDHCILIVEERHHAGATDRT